VKIAKDITRKHVSGILQHFST